MNGITLRPVAPEDADAMAQIHVAAWQAAYSGMIPDEVLRRNDLTQRRLLWRGLLVEAERRPMVDVALLESDGPGAEALAGFIWTRHIDGADAAYQSEVIALNVRPEHWRKGVGRRLMAAAAGRLRGLGAESLYLWVFRDNLVARAFYDSLGGRIVDEDAERFGEVAVPRVAYAWKPMTRLEAAMRS